MPRPLLTRRALPNSCALPRTPVQDRDTGSRLPIPKPASAKSFGYDGTEAALSGTRLAYGSRGHFIMARKHKRIPQDEAPAIQTRRELCAREDSLGLELCFADQLSTMATLIEQQKQIPKVERADAWPGTGWYACLLGVLVFVVFAGVLLGKATFVFRDFGLFSSPVAFYHKDSLWHRELPLWNPFNYCGIPFLAQWNTMVLYPPTVIYLLFPLGWSLSLFCLLHLFWGGLGMNVLARQWTHSRLAGALAGLIFTFNGLSLNFLMWPSHIATLSWLPWVVWLVPEAWRNGGKHLSWAIAAGALQMLAGAPETILFTWGILFLYLCGEWAEKRKEAWQFARRFLGIAFMVALICAAQLLPFLELLVRSQRDAGYGATGWPMPLWGWANFLVPLFGTTPTPQGVFLQQGQYWTSSYYLGLITVFLVVIAMARAREWRIGLMLAVLFMALVLALGDGTMFYRALQRALPWVGFARYPIKFVIVVAALAPLLAAAGLQHLIQRQTLGRPGWTTAVALVLLVGFILILGHATNAAIWGAFWRNGLTRAALFGAMILSLAALLQARGSRQVILGSFLLLLCWLDLLTHVPSQNPVVRSAVYSPGWAAEHLKRSPEPRLGQSRAMITADAQAALKFHSMRSPEDGYLMDRLGMLADCNLLDGTPQASGFFSLVPSEVNNAAGIPYVQTNADFSALLDLMGVSQISSPGSPFDWVARPNPMPLVTAGQQPLFADDQIAFRLFYGTNTDFRHFVCLPPEARAFISATQCTAARVFSNHWSAHGVSFEVESPAKCMAVISQSYYPAWQARIDGRPARLWRANYAFQGLEIPPGRHSVTLLYRDKRFFAGAILSMLGLLAWICLLRRNHQPSHL